MLFGLVGLAWGYWIQQFSQTVYILGAGLAFAAMVRLPFHSRGQKIEKKVQAKKLVKSNKTKKILREIAFLAVLNYFPVKKLIFGHF